MNRIASLLLIALFLACSSAFACGPSADPMFTHAREAAFRELKKLGYDSEQYDPPYSSDHHTDKHPYRDLLNGLPDVRTKLEGKGYYSFTFFTKEVEDGGMVVVFIELAPDFPFLTSATGKRIDPPTGKLARDIPGLRSASSK